MSEGLKPRGDTGAEGNWEHTIGSCAEGVYLTCAYAPYFANQATSTDGLWGIVEVDLDELDEDDLRPDEDFLEQATRGQLVPGLGGPPIPQGTMEERTEWFRERLGNFAHHWEDSLNGLGSVMHMGPIPPEAVTRVSLFNPLDNVLLSSMAIDPTITLMNYSMMSTKYKALTQWFIGRNVSIDDICFPLRLHTPAAHIEKIQQWTKGHPGLTVLDSRKARGNELSAVCW
jgi:hypothetical protein